VVQTAHTSDGSKRFFGLHMVSTFREIHRVPIGFEPVELPSVSS